MKTQKCFVFFLGLFLIFVAQINAHASNQSGNLDDIAKTLVTYFPKMTGKVASVDQEKVILQTQNEAGLSAGLFLAVYRVGEPFSHPVTKTVLGHFENEVAILEVEQVKAGEVTARVVQSKETIVPGDFARLTAMRIPVDVSAGTAEETPETRFFIKEFQSALEETGRFQSQVASAEMLTKDFASQPIYKITLLTLARPIAQGGLNPNTTAKIYPTRFQMRNAKTDRLIFNLEVDIQAARLSDSIAESLPYRFFEKHTE